MIDNPYERDAENAFGGPVKECRRCNEWLPRDDEFFPAESRAKDGLNSWCKACWSEYKIDRVSRGLRA